MGNTVVFPCNERKADPELVLYLLSTKSLAYSSSFGQFKCKSNPQNHFIGLSESHNRNSILDTSQSFFPDFCMTEAWCEDWTRMPVRLSGTFKSLRILTRQLRAPFMTTSSLCTSFWPKPSVTTVQALLGDWVGWPTCVWAPEASPLNKFVFPMFLGDLLLVDRPHQSARLSSYFLPSVRAAMLLSC